MSDIPANGHLPEKRRTLASLAAACVLHALFLALLALVFARQAPIQTPIPVSIDLQPSTGPADGLPDLPSGAAGEEGAAGAAGTEGAAPRAAGPIVPAGSAQGGAASADAAGFVIPTPRAAPAGSAGPSAAGPAFRESGGRTGVSQGLPSLPSPIEGPAVAPIQQGRGSGSGPASGSGSAPVQRSGQGVLVQGSGGAASGGNLDLSQLDKAIAGAGSGTGKGGTGQAGAGGTGKGSSGTGPGGGGTGPGASGSGGGGGGGGGQNYSVVWSQPDASRGRTLLSTVSPKVPSWVSAQGLTLSVTVAFTLLSDGVIGGVVLEQSSGYADVDAAVLDAIRRWRFSASASTASVKGVIPYVIKTR